MIKAKIYTAIGINLLILFLIFILVIFSSIKTSYYSYGPNDHLSLFGIKIDTQTKYIFLHIFMIISETSEVFINEIAMPFIDFNIYNPDKRVITEFTRFELNIFANLMYILNALKKLLMLIVSISQFDIALSKVIYSGLTRVFTIYFILSEKKFKEKELHELETLIILE
jgi:hypothetical protein